VGVEGTGSVRGLIGHPPRGYPAVFTGRLQTCEEIDRAIENFRRHQTTVDDPVALALIAIAIDKLETEKAALHGDDEQS